MSRHVRDLRQIDFKQLLGIARAVILREPTLNDGEWKAAVRDLAAKQGYDEAPGDMLDRAMTHVENALKRTMGPRPVEVLPRPKSTVLTQAPPQSRTHHPVGWEIVQGLMRQLSAPSAQLPTPPLGPRETRDVSETEALDEFWRAANTDACNRLALVQAFAEIAIVRPADWNAAAVRAEASTHPLVRGKCFVCYSAGFAAWHHVIQIQFGGSNYLRNRVQLCATCHAAVHPWLALSPRPTGFTPLAECRTEAFATMQAWAKVSA